MPDDKDLDAFGDLFDPAKVLEESHGLVVRLRCDECGKEHDGISQVELSALIADGWQDVQEVQDYVASCRTYLDGREPPGYSALDWETHLGTCPECAKEEVANA
jgi:hypothetical protein